MLSPHLDGALPAEAERGVELPWVGSEGGEGGPLPGSLNQHPRHIHILESEKD